MFAPIKVLKAGTELHQSLPFPVIHFKGFGRLLSFKNHIIKKLQSRCIETLYNLLENGGTLVWDGDSYKYDSFTFIIPLLFDQLFKFENLKKNTQKNTEKKWLFLAFVKVTDIGRFTNSWYNKLKIDKYNIELLEKQQINFALKPLTQITNWSDLGIGALKITQSNIVICFGGGDVVKNEYLNAKKTIMFYVFGAARFNKQKLEFPALKSLMYFDKNIEKYTNNNRNKYNNIGYYDVYIDEWSVNCIAPLTFCNQYISKISNLEQKNDDNQENKNDNKYRGRGRGRGRGYKLRHNNKRGRINTYYTKYNNNNNNNNNDNNNETQ